MYKDNQFIICTRYNELDELINSIDDYLSEDDIGNPNNRVISNGNQPTVADWNALIEAAKVANENNKRSEEEAANLKIAEYKAANPSQADRTIRRTFRIKRGGLHGLHRIKISKTT
jgi:hypothetical protein